MDDYMKNAKQELQEHLQKRDAKIIAGIVAWVEDYEPKHFKIYDFFQKDQFFTFLDTKYDPSYGSVNLVGQILTDKGILRRQSYSGSEWWEWIDGLSMADYTPDLIKNQSII